MRGPQWKSHVIYGVIIVILCIIALLSIVILRQYAHAVDDLRTQVASAFESQHQLAQQPKEEKRENINNHVRVVIDRHNNTDTPPMTFNQIGYIVANDGFQGRDNRMPLYGQPSPTRRGRFNYYTIEASGIKLPITSSKRDCMDEVGCDEIYDGDQVGVDNDSNEKGWTVRLYKPSTVRFPYY